MEKPHDMTALSRKRDNNETDEKTVVKQKKLVSAAVSLNYDVLLHIFRLLDNNTLKRAALVCKQWKAAAYYPPLWKGVVFSETSISVTDILAKSLHQRNIRVIKLRCRYRKGFSENLASCTEVAKCETLYLYNLPAEGRHLSFPRSFDSLKHLALVNPVELLSIKGLKRLLFSLVNVTQFYIQLEQRTILGTRDYSSFIEVILNCLPKLKDLEVVHGHYVVHKDLANSAVFPQLERLAIDVRNDKHLRYEVGDELISTRLLFPGIKHLTVQICFSSAQELNGKSYISMPSLKSLTVRTEDMPDNLQGMFMKIIKSAINLQALDLTSTCFLSHWSVVSEHFEDIIESLPNLSVLKYRHYVPLKTITKLMPKMKNIEMLAYTSIGFTRDDKPTRNDILEAIDSIQTHMNKLFSLLDVGISQPHYLAMLPNVRYFSPPIGCTMRNYVVKKVEKTSNQTRQFSFAIKGTAFELVKAEKGSADWHEAVCTRWFALTDSYDFDLCAD